MKFIDNIKEDEYTKFYAQHKHFSFLQSYEWGQFCIKGKNQKPYYVGLVDDNNNLVCATLLLRTSLPFGYSYFYAPRGYIIDYKNKELLKEFTLKLKEYLKKKKAIYIKIDPEIDYQTVNNNAEVIDGDNNYELHNYLLKLGYKHLGFNKLYEHNQPRYTFYIDSDYESKMNKSFLKNVEKAQKYNLEFVKGTEKDLDEFKRIYQITKERDNFAGYNLKYYEDFYKTFNQKNMAELFLVKLYPDIIIKTLEKEISDLENNINETKNDNKLSKLNESIARKKKDLDFYKEYKNNKEGIVVSAHIMTFVNGMATALYAGSDKLFQSTYANNYMYYKKIKYAFNHNCDKVDLFGVTGNPHTTYKNLAGIFEFKKQLGGQLHEFVGEYDLISNKFMYYLIKITIPVYRKIKKHLK